MWKTQTTLCKNPWPAYGLLIIFSASSFPVIIKFQPATCNLQNIPVGNETLPKRNEKETEPAVTWTKKSFSGSFILLQGTKWHNNLLTLMFNLMLSTIQNMTIPDSLRFDSEKEIR